VLNCPPPILELTAVLQEPLALYYREWWFMLWTKVSYWNVTQRMFMFCWYNFCSTV